MTDHETIGGYLADTDYPTINRTDVGGLPEGVAAKLVATAQDLIRALSAPPPYTPPADPHDRSKWPTLAVWTANLARAGETGVGDTIHRLLSRAGAQAIAMAFTRITGQACGCSDRQQRLNKLYPY